MSGGTVDGLYFERQYDDRCQIHAINNLFGGACLDASSFSLLQQEYRSQSRMKELYCSIDDNIEATGDFVISFILNRKFGLTSFWIAPFEFTRLQNTRVLHSLLDALDFEQNRFFVLHGTHVWCVKKHSDDVWYAIDSLRGGPQAIEGPDAVVRKDRGFLMPWGVTRALKGTFEMKRVISDYFGPCITSDAICAMLVRDSFVRQPTHFGKCQDWMALFFKYLEFVNPARHKFDTEITAFAEYKKRYEASPLDVVNAIETLPFIITFIVKRYNGH